MVRPTDGLARSVNPTSNTNVVRATPTKRETIERVCMASPASTISEFCPVGRCLSMGSPGLILRSLLSPASAQRDLPQQPQPTGSFLLDRPVRSDQQPIQMLFVVLFSFSSRERSRASAFCRIASILAALSSGLIAFSAGACGALSLADGA